MTILLAKYAIVLSDNILTLFTQPTKVLLCETDL